MSERDSTLVHLIKVALGFGASMVLVAIAVFFFCAPFIWPEFQGKGCGLLGTVFGATALCPAAWVLRMDADRAG